MKFVEEICRRTQERVQRYDAIRTLRRQIEEQKELGEAKLRRLRDHTEKMQRFVISTDDVYLQTTLKF